MEKYIVKKWSSIACLLFQSKLDIHVNPLQSTAESAPVTSLTFLKLMYQVVRATALRLDLFELLPQVTNPQLNKTTVSLQQKFFLV